MPTVFWLLAVNPIGGECVAIGGYTCVLYLYPIRIRIGPSLTRDQPKITAFRHHDLQLPL